ncbi:cytochrome c oxidase subunit II [Flavobacterium sp. GN10]|uniref:cytochrome-c oxidase n=1 Tax=Flavobacterium tagetis TaxID=2801336 RepID=A0ABS1KAA0_9FLAO|nr:MULTISPECIES: cytochrome c oxidase subunit II [Flavobacterium]KAF2340091.1 cytochrome c oxidase subunit II [Flavobacterium tistrianum]MBL0735622.1 cytochrome c oxidase subunit II [Flavobacterium tagetis]MCV2486249.1 cytochrome c oxidase subunit II [Flavobacterium sp. SH_e]MXO03786.1 cytochrome c oxidase subunit II [Flavobacterium sp. HBTb2-11-1]
MTSLLVIIVLVLLAVALWQLTKIFDLTQVGSSSDDSQVASDNDNNVQGYIMFGFLAFIYIFTIYGLLKWGNLVLHTPASEHGGLVDNLMNITWVLIFTVQVITQGLLYWFSFKNRGNKDRKALFFADSNKLEAIWSIIPSVVLACLILYGLYAWNNIMFVDKDEDVIEIELYAQQFKWTARYAGQDNVLGKANVRLIEGVNTLGVDMSDPNAQDDIVVSELHIPKGKKVHFKMRSQDVLHSAYFPHFRAQMNCVPGMVTEFAFVPTYTTAEYRELPFMVEKVAHINKLRAEKSAELVAKGGTALDPYTFDYLLLCNKICGASHYNMQMKVVVDSPEDYKKWLSEKTTLAQDIKAAAAAEKPAEGAAPTTDTAAKVIDTVKTVVDTVKAAVAKVAMK